MSVMFKICEAVALLDMVSGMVSMKGEETDMYKITSFAHLVTVNDYGMLPAITMEMM
jgi:hypothetical protein